MKKIISLALFAVLVAAMGTGTNSCAPSSTTNAPDTTKLVANPSSIALTVAAPKDSSAITLSCGCQFGPFDVNSGPLQITGYGDTSVIKFSFEQPLNELLNTHTLYASISFPDTAKSPGSSTSWIALYFDNLGQYKLYDTIRVTATY